MKIYVEQIPDSNIYNLLDSDLKEDVILTDRTLYQQELTAIYKGFTTSMMVNATPNNVKALGYFGNTDLATAPKKTRKAKIYIDEVLYKSGTITIENVSYKNGLPSLFQFSFSDGQQNLSQLVGDDTLDMLAIGDTTGDIYYDNKSVKLGLQGLQSSSGGVAWFVPFNSTQRIFTLNTIEPNKTDNLVYDVSKPTNSENVYFDSESRPAIFYSDILKRIESKYGFKLNIPYYDIPSKTNQLKNLATQCLGGGVASDLRKAAVTKNAWDIDRFREERFDILIRDDIDGFELKYLGFGGGTAHDATFGFEVSLFNIGNSFIKSLEVWEMDGLGVPLKKLNYTITDGAETGRNKLKVNIGLDVFTLPGETEPSTLVSPLICVMVSCPFNAGWNKTNFKFDWHQTDWDKYILNNVQPQVRPYTNLFSLLPKIKVVDFVKSVYTMFGLKSFTDKDGNIFTINDFWYTPKTVNAGIAHAPKKFVNKQLSKYADRSNVTKKPNVFYDGYNLKHKTSKFILNENYLKSTLIEYGQVRFPVGGNPKSEFLIETVFTAPTLSTVFSGNFTPIKTFYPFGGEAHLNEEETRFVYDMITDELPVFYYRGQATLNVSMAYKENGAPGLQQITKFNRINYLSNDIKTGSSNFISSLFGLLASDLADQNTLYVQGYKQYIEGTLDESRLVHEVNLNLPSKVITNFFSNSQDVVIGEDRFQVMESSISLTTGKSKLTLLNY